MGALSHTIFPLTNLTRQTCFDIRRFPCCGDQLESVKDLRLDFFREGREQASDRVVSYDFFYKDEKTGQLCVIWDDAILALCRGRYIGYIYLDCVLVEKVRFFLGAKPVVEGISFEESAVPNCYSDTVPVQPESLVEPDACCEPECKPRKSCCKCTDPCDPCTCLDEDTDGS